VDKIKRIETYLHNFFSNRFEDLDDFYKAIRQNRTWEIYKLENGNFLLDYVNTIHSYIEERYNFEKLVPHKFVTLEALLTSFEGFEKMLTEGQSDLDLNFKGEETYYIVNTIQHLKDELLEMIHHVRKLYDIEDAIVPYQELRYKLITHNIPDFIAILKSIIASVSYAISKTSEGYFHSNVYLILKLLGFEVLPEDTTNIGRIDAVIRFSDKIYILEFKFNENKDLSDEALQQIIDKKYAQKFVYEKKEIYGIGVSFGKKDRNINGYKVGLIS